MSENCGLLQEVAIVIQWVVAMDAVNSIAIHRTALAGLIILHPISDEKKKTEAQR